MRALSSTSENRVSRDLLGEEKESCVLGTTSSSLSGTRLKGSVVSDKRCDLMVDRSIVVLEDGKITGSRMIVYMRGSDRSTR